MQANRRQRPIPCLDPNFWQTLAGTRVEGVHLGALGGSPSHALGMLHRNFYLFSSIPTERRNVEFKLDVTHCFKGWKLSQPHASRKGFALVLDLSALDVGILLHDARKRGQKRSAMEVDQE